MSHGSYCLHSAVEELAQTIAEYAAKLVVNDNGLYVFCGHCLGYFDVSVVAVINSHGETFMCSSRDFAPAKQQTFWGGIEYGHSI